MTSLVPKLFSGKGLGTRLMYDMLCVCRFEWRLADGASTGAAVSVEPVSGTVLPAETQVNTTLTATVQCACASTFCTCIP